MNAHAVSAEPFGAPQVGATQVGVMREFAASEKACMKGLRRLVLARPMAFEKLSTAVGERHDRHALLAIQGCHDADQPRSTEPVEVSVPQVRRPAAFVVEIAHRHDAKGANRGERPHLGSTELVIVAMHVDALALRPARQVQAAREDITRIHRLRVPRVGRVTVAAVERTRV